jgi:hypothetical protein
MVLRGNFLVLSYSKNNPAMKPMKTSGIILGRTRGANSIRPREMSVMTLTFGGLSVFVRPALAISPTQQQSTISAAQMNAENLFARGTEKIARKEQ